MKIYIYRFFFFLNLTNQTKKNVLKIITHFSSTSRGTCYDPKWIHLKLFVFDPTVCKKNSKETTTQKM